MLHVDVENMLGDFQERDFGNWFSYATSGNPWGIAHGFPHEIYTADGFRPAKVLKTVAYVVVDELANGEPEVEKWYLKRNNQFDR